MKQLLFLFLFFSSVLSAQNLIPNPGFEDHTGCPSGNFQFYLVNNWFNPTVNIPGITGTPDYYNTCATYLQYSIPGTSSYHYQYPRTGDAYVGIWDYYGNSIFPEFREYISVQLSSPLIAGECYQFQMYINMSNGSNAYSSSVGAYFSDTLINSIDSCLHFLFTPQIINPINNYPDTTNWMLVEGTYAAHGGESYIVLGNFYDNSSSTIISLDTNVYKFSYFYIDDVSLTVTACTGVSEGYQKSGLSIFPNPFKNILNVNCVDPIEQINLINTSGQTVFSKVFDGQYVYDEVINLLLQPRGVYFLNIRVRNKVYNVKLTN